MNFNFIKKPIFFISAVAITAGLVLFYFYFWKSAAPVYEFVEAKKRILFLNNAIVNIRKR